MAGAPRRSEVKRHHYIPQCYLRAWADSKGQIAVRRRGSDKTFLSDPLNVGAESRLYGTGPEAMWRERNFGHLEEKWPQLRSELIQHGYLFGADRELASMFLALQIARTREHIASTTWLSELASFTTDRPLSRDTIRAFIADRYRHDPDEAEVEGLWTLAAVGLREELIPTLDDMFSISIDIATKHLAPLIDEFHWRVELADAPILWTSDRPVMPWRTPSESDRYEGVGYLDSQEIRVPLAPTSMLVLERRASVSPVRVPAARFRKYNQDIARQCYEFLVAAPGRAGRLTAIPLAPSRPAIRFDSGPGVQVEPDGSQSIIGDIVQVRIPLRADEVDSSDGRRRGQVG